MIPDLLAAGGPFAVTVFMVAAMKKSGALAWAGPMAKFSLVVVLASGLTILARYLGPETLDVAPTIAACFASTLMAIGWHTGQKVVRNGGGGPGVSGTRRR